MWGKEKVLYSYTVILLGIICWYHIGIIFLLHTALATGKFIATIIILLFFIKPVDVRLGT